MPVGENDADSGAEEQRQARFRVLDLSAVGIAFPIALLLGYFGGRLIGGWLGNAQVGAMIGALVGIGGGFYNLFKMVSRLAPRTVAAASSAPTGPPPPPEISSDEAEPLDLDDADLDDFDDLDDDAPDDRGDRSGPPDRDRPE